MFVSAGVLKLEIPGTVNIFDRSY